VAAFGYYCSEHFRQISEASTTKKNSIIAAPVGRRPADVVSPPPSGLTPATTSRRVPFQPPSGLDLFKWSQCNRTISTNASTPLVLALIVQEEISRTPGYLLVTTLTNIAVRTGIPHRRRITLKSRFHPVVGALSLAHK
jgi:hypothetical protein